MLSLKQARRMVAKSRRRVWRLARELRPTVMIIAGDNGLAGYYAETWIPATMREQRRTQMPEMQAVCAAFVRRLHVLWDMEMKARDRAWARSRELPALDYGQDGDELLQDVADYYADSRACPVCGAEMDWIECDHCGGEGGRDNDALMEEDPLWYDGVEWEDCGNCQGKGGWWQCYRALRSEVRREQ